MSHASQEVTNPNKATRNIFQVVKRSGEAVLFDEQKLKRSVVLALRAAQIEDNPISNSLVDEVIRKLGEELEYKEKISTLDIREAIEIALLERGLTSAAQQYHDFVSVDRDDEAEHESIVGINTTLESSTNKVTKEVVEEMLATGPQEPEQIQEPIPVQEVQESVAQSITQSKSQAAQDASDEPAILHPFSVGHYTGYIIVSLNENNQPKKIMLHSESGADFGIVQIFVHMVSVALEYNVPLTEVLPAPDVYTIERAKDLDEIVLVEYIINWLSQKN